MTSSTPSQPPRRTPYQSGLTLIELLVTLSVALTLGFIAAPSFTTQIAESRQSAAIGALSKSVSLARSSAIKTSRPVVICISTDQQTCAAETVTDWASGWMVFLDANGDGSFTTEGKDTVLSVQSALRGLTNATATHDTVSLTFFPNGSTDLGAESTFTFKSSVADVADKKLSINVLGRFYRPS